MDETIATLVACITRKISASSAMTSAEEPGELMKDGKGSSNERQYRRANGRSKGWSCSAVIASSAKYIAKSNRYCKTTERHGFPPL